MKSTSARGLSCALEENANHNVSSELLTFKILNNVLLSMGGS